jgi:hypothetical protein
MNLKIDKDGVVFKPRPALDGIESEFYDLYGKIPTPKELEAYKSFKRSEKGFSPKLDSNV